jgi:hypothetical protein
MDSYLLKIIQAAEADQPTPAVNLVTNGGDWIRGRPCSSRQFQEITWSHLVKETEQALNKRPRYERKQNPADANDAVDIAAVPFAALVEGQGAPVEPALSLTGAILSFGGRANGMQLSAVRVPAKAISSWWVSGGSYVKPDSSGGGGVFAGVLFPIGN